MIDLTYVADYLRSWRQYKRMTIAMVRARSGVSTHEISQLERKGKASLNTLWKLSQIYRLNMSTLFEFSELAALIGIEAAYESEAPHLLDARLPIKVKILK